MHSQFLLRFYRGGTCNGSSSSPPRRCPSSDKGMTGRSPSSPGSRGWRRCCRRASPTWRGRRRCAGAGCNPRREKRRRTRGVWKIKKGRCQFCILFLRCSLFNVHANAIVVPVVAVAVVSATAIVVLFMLLLLLLLLILLPLVHLEYGRWE